MLREWVENILEEKWGKMKWLITWMINMINTHSNKDKDNFKLDKIILKIHLYCIYQTIASIKAITNIHHSYLILILTNIIIQINNLKIIQKEMKNNGQSYLIVKTIAVNILMKIASIINIYCRTIETKRELKKY